LGAWLVVAGLVMLPLILAALGFIAWIIHHRPTTAAVSKTNIHKEGVKP